MRFSGVNNLRRIVFVSVWMLAAPQCKTAVYVADPWVTDGPGFYVNLVSQLEPGDTLILPAGVYKHGLDLSALKGTSSAWITVTGPESGGKAVVTTATACCNAVQLDGTAFVALRNLTIDANSEGVGASIDGVNANGQPTHDILIENCIITGTGFHQQTVGISTKTTAWNWVVKNNVIDGAGTGAYFGRSDGSARFLNGIIEGNVFIDSIGYNLQVKHHSIPEDIPGLPAAPRQTIIRHNVFVKRVSQAERSSVVVDGRRPNVLIGGSDVEGDGSADRYQIYGNFFYHNADRESLIQASGRVSIHDNIFVGPAWAGIHLRDHNFPLSSADVYNNTIYGVQIGIYVASGAVDDVRVIGNLVFGLQPILGHIDQLDENITDTIEKAVEYLRRPSVSIEDMDFYPISGQVVGDRLPLESMSDQLDYDKDFNGDPKGDFQFRGAYSGRGRNPGWRLGIGRKAIDATAYCPDYSGTSSPSPGFVTGGEKLE